MFTPATASHTTRKIPVAMVVAPGEFAEKSLPTISEAARNRKPESRNSPVRISGRRQLEADDARDHEADADQADRVRRLVEQHDSENDGADGAHADPDAIRGADRQRLGGDAE